MKIIFCYILMLFALSGDVLAHRQRGVGEITLKEISYLIDNYYEKTGGNYPTSWKEFYQQTNYHDNLTMEKARWYLNIEQRYQFLNPPLKVTFPAKREIILLATDNELEAINHHSPEKKARWSIVREDDGTMGAYRFEERHLKKALKQHGLSLEAYTRHNTFKAPSKQASERHFAVLKNREYKDKYGVTMAESHQRNRAALAKASRKKTVQRGLDRSNRLNGLIVLSIIIVSFVFILAWMKRSGKHQRG